MHCLTLNHTTWQPLRDSKTLTFGNEQGNLLRTFIKTLNGSFSKDYSLKDQINRSNGSVMDNIAEGFERDGRQEFLQFLSVSKSSTAEIKSQLYRALDRNHITEAEFENLFEQARSEGKMIGGFMSYLRKSEYKGLKYKTINQEK